MKITPPPLNFSPPPPPPPPPQPYVTHEATFGAEMTFGRNVGKVTLSLMNDGSVRWKEIDVDE